MLHVTHSAIAAERLRAADLPGEVTTWGEAGQAGLAGEREEVVLWFGEAGGAQRAMLEVVAACPSGVPVSFICTEPDLENATTARLAWLFHHRPTAGRAFFRLCALAHAALAAGPEAVEQAMPHLDALPLVQRALAS